MQDSKLFPGQQSSYEVRVNTIGFQRALGAVDFYFNQLPPAVHHPDEGFYDIFTEGDYFIDGFFDGYEVDWASTTIYYNRGSVGMVRPPYVRELNDKIIRYFFDVPAETEPGFYSIRECNEIT